MSLNMQGMRPENGSLLRMQCIVKFRKVEAKLHFNAKQTKGLGLLGHLQENFSICSFSKWRGTFFTLFNSCLTAKSVRLFIATFKKFN